MHESMAVSAKNAQVPRLRAEVLYRERINVMDMKRLCRRASLAFAVRVRVSDAPSDNPFLRRIKRLSIGRSAAGPSGMGGPRLAFPIWRAIG